MLNKTRLKSIPSGIKGFTLIEALIVVLILGILSSMAIPAYSNYYGRVRQIEAIQIIEKVSEAEVLFFIRPRILANGVQANPCFLMAEGGTSTFPNGGPAPWYVSTSGLPGMQYMHNVLKVQISTPVYYWIYGSAGIGPFDSAQVCNSPTQHPKPVPRPGIKFSIFGNGSTDGISGGDLYAAGCGENGFGFLRKDIVLNGQNMPEPGPTMLRCAYF